jgi:PKD repeat protein
VILITGTGHRTADAYNGRPGTAPLLHIEFATSPGGNLPPVVRAGPDQTITLPAGASLPGTVTDDGLPNPPGTVTSGWTTASGPAQANFASPSSPGTTATFPTSGTYVLRLTGNDGELSAYDEVTITVNAPTVDNPPVAALSVTNLSSPALTVRADGSASTDTDATPIASYKFLFGDGTAEVTTLPPVATAQHTYAIAGTYTVTLTVTDTAGKASAPVTRSVTVSDSPGLPIAVYAGYYDTHHSSNIKAKPNPWSGSAGAVFVGKPDSSSGGWDTAAVRIDNLTGGTLTGVVVSVDVGSHHYALWGTSTIPAGGRLILAQTAFENFDLSDTNSAGCYSCSGKLCITSVMSTVPVVHVTVGGQTFNFFDPGQVLNTHGVDSAGCPYTGTRNDESQNWIQIG